MPINVRSHTVIKRVALTERSKVTHGERDGLSAATSITKEVLELLRRCFELKTSSTDPFYTQQQSHGGSLEMACLFVACLAVLIFHEPSLGAEPPTAVFKCPVA